MIIDAGHLKLLEPGKITLLLVSNLSKTFLVSSELVKPPSLTAVKSRKPSECTAGSVGLSRDSKLPNISQKKGDACGLGIYGWIMQTNWKLNPNLIKFCKKSPFD